MTKSTTQEEENKGNDGTEVKSRTDFDLHSQSMTHDSKTSVLESTAAGHDPRCQVPGAPASEMTLCGGIEEILTEGIHRIFPESL